MTAAPTAFDERFAPPAFELSEDTNRAIVLIAVLRLVVERLPKSHHVREKMVQFGNPLASRIVPAQGLYGRSAEALIIALAAALVFVRTHGTETLAGLIWVVELAYSPAVIDQMVASTRDMIVHGITNPKVEVKTW